MAAITHVRNINFVAKMLDEEVDLLEAIISNDDNLIYVNRLVKQIAGRPAFH